MVSVIPSNKSGTCLICLETEFSDLNPPVTHVGGEAHEPFHLKCLVKWEKEKSICPVCRIQIDTSSLATEKDLVRSAIFNALSAASVGFLMVSGEKIRGVFEKKVEFLARSAITIVVTQQFLFRDCEPLSFEYFQSLGTISAIGSCSDYLAKVTEESSVAGIGMTVFAGGVLLLRGVETEGNRSQRKRIRDQNIAVGLIVGALVPLVVGTFFSRQTMLESTPLALPVIAGATAGVLSLIRK